MAWDSRKLVMHESSEQHSYGFQDRLDVRLIFQ